MLSSMGKIYTKLVREKIRWRPVFYALTIITCCVVTWDPSFLEPLIGIFSPRTKNTKVGLSKEHASHAIVRLHEQPFQEETEPPLSKILDLPFVPKDHKCEDLFEKSGFNFSYSSHFWAHIDSYKYFLMEIGRIQDVNTDEQTWIFHELAKHPSIQTICEVGFNTGHNAFYCLSGRYDVVLHSFEDRVSNLTKKLAQFMTDEFAFQFFSHFGRFTQEVPKFFSENNNTKCDLILLDSSLSAHKMEFLMETFSKVANPEQNFVILDAHPKRSKRESLRIWEKARRERLLVENFRCLFPSENNDVLRRPNVTGFVLGHFIPGK